MLGVIIGSAEIAHGVGIRPCANTRSLTGSTEQIGATWTGSQACSSTNVHFVDIGSARDAEKGGTCIAL